MKDSTVLNADLAPGPLAVGFSRVKLLLALSRTPHGLLDLAAPALAALLWLGRLPPLGTTALGLLTVFAGYTAVYALNDLVDCRVDRDKLRLQGGPGADYYLDAVFLRHPLAAGKVSLPEGLLWTGAWALVAFLGAYCLNPVCALIFLAGCLLETAYCLLLRVSHWRLLVAGVVKSLGALARVLAVGVLGLSLVFSLMILQMSPARFSLFQQLLIFGGGIYLLLLPAWGLLRSGARSRAATLFNRASYYPLAVLAVVLLHLAA